MPNGDLNWIANFIWGIADDVLRDVYVRGKYRDVILPMTVIRRLDAVLEPTKQDVLRMSEQLDKAGVANKDAALRQAAGPDANHAFYNDSPFTLRDLQARAKQQQLKADFKAYLDGFSPNVQEILDKFKFRFLVNKLTKMVEPTGKSPLGSRIAEVHNGSSLFTGDAGSIDWSEREIDLIREYRTRLIADAVTGKVDVRGIVVERKKSTTVIQFPKEKKSGGPRANVHFRRSVFAAEIVSRLHAEPTFGHVKFEKLIFLCEKQCGVDTGSTYHRQAAGPYDNRALRSIDSQMEKQKWYAARKVQGRYQYVPLAKAGGHKTYFSRYFADIEEKFSNIIEMFRKLDTERCEIVVTLYSAWEDLLANDEEASEDSIVEQVLHHWHPSKQRIGKDRWYSAIGWMKEKDFVPKVTGVTHGSN